MRGASIFMWAGHLMGKKRELKGILRKSKRNFWHTDYLLEYSEILGIIYLITSQATDWSEA